MKKKIEISSLFDIEKKINDLIGLINLYIH